MPIHEFYCGQCARWPYCVDDFIDGYVQIDNNHLALSLKLIETQSGLITWAKTIEMPAVLEKTNGNNTIK